MWPWFSRPADRWINKKMLVRAVNQAAAHLPRPLVAVTTLPIVADLTDSLDVDSWLYYCVDDLSLWPGLDGTTLREMESKLVERVDHVVTVSQTLQQRMGELGRESTLITHGVELDLWKASAIEPPVARSGPSAPQAVFWGLIDGRLETEWVLALADRLDRGSVVLVGPIETIDKRLRSHPRVSTTGAVAYESLPGIARSASVLVMPYKDLPVTRSMQPLKLKEYLATGLPVVARDLPATSEWSDCLDLVSTRDDFVDAVANRIDGGISAAQAAARVRLEQEGWEAKARSFLVEIERAAC
ncbi:glycosyltransferase [Posidoniimonas corsicana]|nr:glycosyltransferase [Posidoniimonas corsicana]